MKTPHWSMSVGPCALLIFSIFASTTIVVAEPLETRDKTDWFINEDKILVDQNISIQGNVTILANATLRLEGVHLEMGGRLLVGPEATLLLANSSTGPSSISAISEDHSFWIKVQGEMRTEGTGPHVIQGLHGVGLASAFAEGGLRIEGHADLRDTHIRDGKAGIIVMEEGNLILHESVVSDLGDVGITVLGSMHLESAVLEKSDMGVLARTPCDVNIIDTEFNSKSTNVFVNGCRVKVTDSVLEGAYSSLGANNEAILEVRSTLLRNYTQQGLTSYAYPDGDGIMSRPRVHFHDVTFEPDPAAQRGTELRGLALAEFHNVTLKNHREHGIQAQTTALFVQDSTIQNNGGHDIELAGGHFLNEPLTSGNRFGSTLDNETSAKDAISHVVIARLSVVDGTETLIPGDISLDVYRMETGEPVELFTSENSGSGTIRVMFQAYGTDSEGNPEYLGPFGYEAAHPAGHTEWKGELQAKDGTTLLFLAADSVETEPLPAPPLWSLIVVLFGALFAASETRKRDG